MTLPSTRLQAYLRNPHPLARAPIRNKTPDWGKTQASRLGDQPPNQPPNVSFVD